MTFKDEPVEPTWTASQLEAIKKVIRWLELKNSPVFYLYGYAGTGKTTILKHLATRNVRVAAYTGKAAFVLRKKGCPATTIHSMIYHPADEDPVLRQRYEELIAKRGELGYLSMEESLLLREILKELSKREFVLNENAFTIDRKGRYIGPPPVLIAIDEASMVDEEIGRDLLSFGIPVLVVMDPAQLPPIKGTGYFITETPDVMLTEIHRQALHSGIIRMATAVRQDYKIYHCNFGADAKITRNMPTDWFDDSELQLLCGKNTTRFLFNKMARDAFGFTNPLPVVGDKLCCWRNNHQLQLLNGSFWRVLDVNYRTPASNTIVLSLRSDDNELDEKGNARELHGCDVHKRRFLEAKVDEDTWDWRDRSRADEFSFGYALTVHKAQGSEWKKVILIDESYLWGEKDKRWWGGQRNNWLYTGITRAEKQLTLVRT